MSDSGNFFLNLRIVPPTHAQPITDDGATVTSRSLRETPGAPTQSNNFSGQVVDSFVLTMKSWFDRWIIKSFRARGSGPSSTGPRAGVSCLLPSSSNSSEPSGSKRQREEDSCGESDSEADDSGNWQRHKRAKPNSIKVKNFGCPFFKHSPADHVRFQSCAGPGFPTVHRVKQHLYKRHRLPDFRCLRCFECFADGEGLASHSRSTRPCQIQAPRLIEGISKQQELELKKRSKNSHSEHQRWVDVYLLIFPEERGEDVPSPYVDDDDVAASAEPPTPCASFRCSLQDNYQDLERFLFCESRRHLIKQLKEAGGLFESLLRRPEDTRIAEIIPKVLIGLLREFHEERCIARSSSRQEDQPRSSDTEDVCDLAELDELAQFIPADLSPAQLDPFSHLPLPPIPTDIVNSLDWLASYPNTNFDTFFKPPSVVPVPEGFLETTFSPSSDQHPLLTWHPGLAPCIAMQVSANVEVIRNPESGSCQLSSASSIDQEALHSVCCSCSASTNSRCSETTNSCIVPQYAEMDIGSFFANGNLGLQQELE